MFIVRMIKYLFRGIGIILLAYGAFFFGGGHYVVNRDDLHEETPLGRTKGIVVSKAGEIYLGSQSYSRIQVYDMDGRFLRGFQSSTRPFEFQLSPDESTLKLTGGRVTYVLDSRTGKILEEKRRRSSSTQSKNEAYDINGNKYELEDSCWTGPSVRRVSPEGDVQILISQPWYIWVNQTPEPSYCIATLGMLCVLLTCIPQIRQQYREYRAKRGKKKKATGVSEEHKSGA